MSPENSFSSNKWIRKKHFLLKFRFTRTQSLPRKTSSVHISCSSHIWDEYEFNKLECNRMIRVNTKKKNITYEKRKYLLVQYTIRLSLTIPRRLFFTWLSIDDCILFDINLTESFWEKHVISNWRTGKTVTFFVIDFSLIDYLRIGFFTTRKISNSSFFIFNWPEKF